MGSLYRNGIAHRMNRWSRSQIPGVTRAARSSRAEGSPAAMDQRTAWHADIGTMTRSDAKQRKKENDDEQW
jgi:hypothetical protein